jgi:hypothetical protein
LCKPSRVTAGARRACGDRAHCLWQFTVRVKLYTEYYLSSSRTVCERRAGHLGEGMCQGGAGPA